MKIKDMEDILKEYGTGKTEALNQSQLRCLQSVCKNFREVIVDNCMSHALYRCNISSKENLILIVIWGTNERGNMKELQVGLNLDTNEVYTYKLELENKKLVGQEIYNMLVKLMDTIPFTVGMLDIPMEGRFEEGVISGYKKEKGTVLFAIKDSLENSFFTEY